MKLTYIVFECEMVGGEFQQTEIKQYKKAEQAINKRNKLLKKFNHKRYVVEVMMVN